MHKKKGQNEREKKRRNVLEVGKCTYGYVLQLSQKAAKYNDNNKREQERIL